MNGWRNYDSWLTSQPDGVEEFEHFANEYHGTKKFMQDARRWMTEHSEELKNKGIYFLNEEEVCDYYCESDEYTEAVQELIEERKQQIADAIIESREGNS